jgi:glycosidase
LITQDDVIYMIVTDRFADGDPANNGEVDRSALEKRHGGDLLGIVQRMPYLQALGVTALWITPVYLNPPDGYHGYYPLDFERVDPHLCSPELGPAGSREVVRRFVEIAHEHGLKVILDVIVSHTARNHPWRKERPDWYDENASAPEKWWIWGLPSLNHDNIDVNLYFAENVLDWMTSTGVDGMRIDAALHVERPFWRVFKLFAKGLQPDVTLIGEVWDGDVAQVAPYQAYHGFDSMFDFPLYFAIQDVFVHDQSFGRIARPELSENEPPGILNMDEAYRNAYHLITFLGNHDTPRFFHLAGGVERQIDALIRTRLALTFLFTTRGIPQLYYGDELAMEGGPHPDNRRDMPWERIEGEQPTNDDRPTTNRPSGHTEAPVGATEALVGGRSSLIGEEVERALDMRHFTRKLVDLRRSSTALRHGLLTTLYLTPTLYAFARTFLDDARLVVLNNAWDTAHVTIPIHANPRLSTLARRHLHEGLHLINDLNPNDRIQVLDGGVRVHLAGKTGAVYRSIASR